MDNHDDRSAVVYVLAGVGLGALIGAAAALLFAPQAGAEMREDLGHKLEDLRTKVSDLTSEVTTKLGDTVDKAKSAVRHQTEQAADALEAKASENA